MKLKTLFISCILFPMLTAQGQEVLLHRNVSNDMATPKRGPNRTHFNHLYMNFGFITGAPENSNASIVNGSSNAFQLGYRYKLKLNNYFSTGCELSYSATSYRIAQKEGKLVPDAILHKKESLNLQSFVLGIYQRTNFGRRGDHMGNYLDLGAFGGWNVGLKHQYKDEIDGVRINTEKRGMKYWEPFSYGVMARVGFTRWSVTGSYRLSNMFKSQSGIPELPRVQVGLELGLF